MLTPMTHRFEAAGFVLTGGRSCRMGRDKALLPLAGQPLVLRTVGRFEPLVATVTLVGAPERYAGLGLPVLADREAGKGPLAGIVTALGASRHDWSLVVACDLPYLETRFVEFLLERTTGSDADAVVPHTAGRWQPLSAVYHRRTLPVFERVLAEGNPKIARAFEELQVHSVTEEEMERFDFPGRMLKNMNTPEDYEEARRLLEGP
jgi:molybdopterin-guanine dinucleotide biosynthesis protein A